MPHRIVWSWYTGRWWVGCYIWYSEEGTGWGRSSPRPLLAVPNVTALHQRPVYQSTASVPITVLLYNRQLLCGFNVPIKGLRQTQQTMSLRRTAVYSHWNKAPIQSTKQTTAFFSSAIYARNNAIWTSRIWQHYLGLPTIPVSRAITGARPTSRWGLPGMQNVRILRILHCLTSAVLLCSLINLFTKLSLYFADELQVYSSEEQGLRSLLHW